MLNRVPCRTLPLLAAVFAVLAALACLEERKTELKYSFVFGPDGVIKVEGESYGGFTVTVTPAMLSLGDKRASISADLHVEAPQGNENCCFYFYDAAQFWYFANGLPATPLNSTEHSNSCVMWRDVTEPDNYRVVIKNNDSLGHDFNGIVYLSYWGYED